MKRPSKSQSEARNHRSCADHLSERRTLRLNGVWDLLNQTPIQIYGPYLDPRSVQVAVTERTALPMNTPLPR